MTDLEVALTEEMQQIARAALLEGSYYAKPEHQQDQRWKDTAPSKRQLRLIRMRRGGPSFNYPIPEALYKAMMIALTGEPTSRAITTREQAVTYLDAVSHIDPEHLKRIALIIARIKFGGAGHAHP